MDLEQLRKIDEDRMTLVSFYVDDSVRGIDNVGLTEDENEALRLVAAYERENGRQPGVGEARDGYVRAASRLLDNAFRADDGPWELATQMAADLALQRHASEAISASDRFAKEGVEPVGFDSAMVEYVIKSDMIDDPEVRSDWKAIAEGRYHDVVMLDEIVFDGVMRSEHLPQEASDWMYSNRRVEEEVDFSSRRSQMDVLDILDDSPAYEPTGRDYAEWRAGEPDAHEWDEAREKAESDRFFGRTSEKDVSRSGRDERLDPSELVTEVERHSREGFSFADKSVYEAAEMLGRMDEGDLRADSLANALAHSMMGDLGMSAAESAAWAFEPRDPAPLGDLVSAVRRADVDDRFGLSEGTSARIAMSQAKDDVRSLTVDDRSVSGTVAACELASENRDVPFNELLAGVVRDRRRFEPEFGRESTMVHVAVSSIARLEAIEKANEARSTVREAASDEKPFFAVPTNERMDRASEDVRDVLDARRMSDHTILLDGALSKAFETLDAAGFDMEGTTSSRNLDRLESAWERVLETRESGVSLTRDQEARQVVYDFATQAEAAGISSGHERTVDEGTTGRVIVQTMGIRSITQEQKGPVPLSRLELGLVSAGNFSSLPLGAQAGLSLGTSHARDSERYPLREPMIARPAKAGGLLAQAARASDGGFVKADAKARPLDDRDPSSLSRLLGGVAER